MRLEDLRGWVEYDVFPPEHPKHMIAIARIQGPVRYPRPGEGTYPHPCRSAWNPEVERFIAVTQKALDEGSTRPLGAGRELNYIGQALDQYDAGHISLGELMDRIREQVGEPESDHGSAEEFDAVAELKRQVGIIGTARRRAEEHGDPVPDSGMPGYDEWVRRVLLDAGETYRIIRGERRPLV